MTPDHTDARAPVDGDGGASFDPRFDVVVFAPAPTLGGPALHEFAADEDPEIVASIERTTRSLPAPSLALVGYQPIEPDRARVQIVHATAARAAACGLSLPATLVRFVTGAPADLPRGVAYWLFKGASRIVIRADVPHHDLRPLLLHELMHAADMHAGLFETMTVSEREHRAVVFALRATEGWAFNP